MANGPKYRENNSVSWKADATSLMEGLNDYIETWFNQDKTEKFIKELPLNQNETSTNETYIQVNKSNNQNIY